MTTDLRSLDLACMDCGRRPSHYFPPGSFGLATMSFLCVSCAESRLAAFNYAMHIREVAQEKAMAMLEALKRISEPPAPPLPSGTLCSGKPPLPDVVVNGEKEDVEKGR
jgi:hypothetical protein